MNMDNAYLLPKLSAENFAYTRLPHLSHGIFCSGPIAGTLALSSHLSDVQATQLDQQHRAQTVLYGTTPSAAIHVPAPGCGRSFARGASRVRPAPVAVPPRPGAPICPKFFASHFTVIFLDRFTTAQMVPPPILF